MAKDQKPKTPGGGAGGNKDGKKGASQGEGKGTGGDKRGGGQGGPIRCENCKEFGHAEATCTNERFFMPEPPPKESQGAKKKRKAKESKNSITAEPKEGEGGSSSALVAHDTKPVALRDESPRNVAQQIPREPTYTELDTTPAILCGPATVHSALSQTPLSSPAQSSPFNQGNGFRHASLQDVTKNKESSNSTHAPSKAPAELSDLRQTRTFVPGPSNQGVETTHDEKTSKGKEKQELISMPWLAPVGALRPPRLPGRLGMPTTALANFFEIPELPPQLYKYSVKLPKVNGREVKNRDVKRILFELLFAESTFPGYRKQLATDWQSIIVTTQPLSEVAISPNSSVVNSIPSVSVRFENQTGQQERLSIEFPSVEVLQTDKLSRYVRHEGLRDFNYADIVAAINIIVNKYPSRSDSGVTLTGRNKFFVNPDANSSSSKELGRGLHARRGYFTSPRPGDGKMYLNINVAVSAFHTVHKNLAVFMKEFFKDDGIRMLTDPQLKLFRSISKGLKVYCLFKSKTGSQYGNQSAKERKKTITGLGAPAGQESFFHRTKARNYTIAQYFLEELQRPVEYPELPTINVGGALPEERVLVPAEYLRMADHQLFRGKIFSELTPRMHEFACQTPSKNRDFIQSQGMKMLGISPPSAQLLESYGLKIDKSLTKITARLLDYPTLQFRGTDRQVPVSGSWNIKFKTFIKPSRLEFLHVLVFGGIDYKCRSSAQELQNALHGHGLETRDKQVVGVPSLEELGGSKFGERLCTELERALAGLRNPVRLLVVVLEEKDEEVYSIIKRWGDSEKGLPTVCVTFTNYIKKAGSLLGNLALKINLKLNGTAHALPKTFYSNLFQGDRVDTMIVGADVTHPSRQSIDNCPSIAGVVASIDELFSNYPGSLRLQESKKEVRPESYRIQRYHYADRIHQMITELRSMIAERLTAWYKRNSRRLPNNILFYRDGVSESQFTHVKNHELPQIELGCSDAFHTLCIQDPNLNKLSYVPRITLVVVGKRHQTRFYPAEETSKGHLVRNGNFKPGLVVDSDICSPYFFDFYLQAHDSLKGTARSAHYWVLENGMDFTSNELQSLTHDLCYNYARATKAVSYVPAAYIADRLCERGRVYLRPMLNNYYQNQSLTRDSTPQQVLNIARSDRSMWQTPESSGVNPWHKNLDEVMFWL
ncbi:MAG: hypothetical protein M1835_007658 [Candelina submexicana]|nr:MAG: hypothetical protein M1835_007658 [Candelina submexicana]